MRRTKGYFQSVHTIAMFHLAPLSEIPVHVHFVSLVGEDGGKLDKSQRIYLSELPAIEAPLE